MKRSARIPRIASAMVWNLLLVIPVRGQSLPIVVYQSPFDGLALGPTQPFPGHPGQGGWFSELAQLGGFGEMQSGVANGGAALHEHTSASTPPGLQSIDKRSVLPPDLGVFPRIVLRADFRCHSSGLSQLNSYSARLAVNGGPHPGFEIIGFELVAGNGTGKATNLGIKVDAYDAPAINNFPIPLTVGQGLTWDAWHSIVLVADQSADRWVSITIDGVSENLSGFVLPRSGSVRGQLMEFIEAQIIPSQWNNVGTHDDVYWDNVTVEVSSPPAAVGPSVINPTNGHRYWRTQNIQIRASAAALAASLGAHLVTFSNAAEENWVIATFGTEPYWFGLSRNPPGGSFAWDTGESLCYENWCPFEPNNSGAGENFGIMNWCGVSGGPGTAPTGWNDAEGHPQDFYRAMIEKGPEYQVNQPAAILTLDTESSTAYHLARVEKYVGFTTLLSWASTGVGLPWDLAACPVPAVSASEGASYTPGGQLVNIDLLGTPVSWLNGLSLTVPFTPATLSLVLAAPVTLSAQMFVITPSVPELVALSSAVELVVRPAFTVPGPTNNDGSVGVVLPQGFPPIRFQGTFYTSFYINANGSVSFGAPYADATPSPQEFDDPPRRLAGMWTDLRPDLGGSITATLSWNGSSGSYDVVYSQVSGPQGSGCIGNSVRLQFLPQQNTASIFSYQPDPAQATPTIVGMSGSFDPTGGLGYDFSTVQSFQCSGGSNCSGRSVYQYEPGGGVLPVGWSSVIFPNGDSSEWFVQ